MKAVCPRCGHKKYKKFATTLEGHELTCKLCRKPYFIRHIETIPLPTVEQVAVGPVYLRYGRISSLSDGSLTKEKQDTDTLDFGKRTLEHKGYSDGGFWFDESVSGSTPFLARPAAATLWRCSKKGDCIVVSKLDRAFRRCSDALKVVEFCEERGIGFHILNIGLDTSSPMGRLVLTVMAGIAEMERQNTVIRNREDVAARRAAGRPISRRAPLGWKVVRTDNGAVYRPCEDSRRRCLAAKELRDKGYTYPQVAELLERMGILNENNRRYDHEVVSRMVKAVEEDFPDPKIAYAKKARGLPIGRLSRRG